MKNWKLKYKKHGHFATMTNWLDQKTAENWYAQLEADESCSWCELIYNPGDNDYIMDEFFR